MNLCIFHRFKKRNWHFQTFWRQSQFHLFQLRLKKISTPFFPALFIPPIYGVASSSSFSIRAWILPIFSKRSIVIFASDHQTLQTIKNKTRLGTSTQNRPLLWATYWVFLLHPSSCRKIWTPKGFILPVLFDSFIEWHHPSPLGVGFD